MWKNQKTLLELSHHYSQDEMGMQILHQIQDPIIFKCVDYLRNRALKIPGLFHSSANLTMVKHVLGEIRAGKIHSLSEIENVHIVSNLLMYHLRELPEPLFTFKLYDRVIKIGAQRDVPPVSLRRLVEELPLQNRLCIQKIILLLRDIEAVALENKSKVYGLAQIFAPLLCKHINSAYMSVRHVQGQSKSRIVVHALMDHYDQVFGDLHLTSYRKLHTSAGRREKEMQLVHSLIEIAVQKILCKQSSNSWLEVLSIRDLTIKNVVRKADQLVAEKDYRRWKTKDRRLVYQASRVLRNEISKYEKLLGDQNQQKPNENCYGDMSVVYTQYNKWKRLMRENASVVIQAIARGYLMRWKQVTKRLPSVKTGRSNLEMELHQIEVMPPADLLALKLKLKSDLKHFDANFLLSNGRLPTKQEKTPMRASYEKYHRVKARLIECQSSDCNT